MQCSRHAASRTARRGKWGTGVGVARKTRTYCRNTCSAIQQGRPGHPPPVQIRRLEGRKAVDGNVMLNDRRYTTDIGSGTRRNTMPSLSDRGGTLYSGLASATSSPAPKRGRMSLERRGAAEMEEGGKADALYSLHGSFEPTTTGEGGSGWTLSLIHI